MGNLLRQLVRRLAVTGGLLAATLVALQHQQMTLVVQESGTLGLSGDVSGLQPGVPGVLALRIHNSGPATVVHRLTVVPTADVRGCSLSVTPWVGNLAVPSHASATQRLVVRISGPTCSGKSWRLAYKAA